MILRIQGLAASSAERVKDSSEMLKNYKDLKVWQKSYGLCLDIYRITRKFPKEETMLKALIKSLEKKHLAP